MSKSDEIVIRMGEVFAIVGMTKGALTYHKLIKRDFPDKLDTLPKLENADNVFFTQHKPSGIKSIYHRHDVRKFIKSNLNDGQVFALSFRKDFEGKLFCPMLGHPKNFGITLDMNKKQLITPFFTIKLLNYVKYIKKRC